MDAAIREKLEKLPEAIELTEPQWYEYHYHLKRNLLLVDRLLSVIPRPEKILVVEAENTYIVEVLAAAGFKPEWQAGFDVAGEQDDRVGSDSAAAYDLIMLLNILEQRPEYPEDIVAVYLDRLIADGRIFMITENRLQVKNRILTLLGRTLFQIYDEEGRPGRCRQYSMNELLAVVNRLDARPVTHQFSSPYPPFRMEPLSLLRYLRKYFNYLVMKVFPGAKNLLYLELVKGGKAR